MVANMSGADGHESSVRHGGALELRFLAWAFWHSAYNSQAALTAPPFVTPGAQPGRPALLRLARAHAHPARPDPARPRAALREVGARDLLTRADYDDYWKHPSVNPRAPLGPLPRHAHPARGRLVRLLHARHLPELRRPGRERAAAGARPGGPVDPRLAGRWSSPTPATWSSATHAALPSFDELHLRWFDRWLRGVDNGLDAEAPAPHLRDGRRLGPALGRGPARARRPLARRARVAAGPHAVHRLLPARRRVAHHGAAARGAARPPPIASIPANPVPSIGGNVSSLRDVLPLPAGHRGPELCRRATSAPPTSCARAASTSAKAPAFHGCRPPYLPLGSRPDVLVFQTEPLREPTEVTGPIEVILWVAHLRASTPTSPPS